MSARLGWAAPAKPGAWNEDRAEGWSGKRKIIILIIKVWER